MKFYFLIIFTSLCTGLFSQNIGDTIKVKAFHYGSTNRDTTVNFPSNLNFEKILLKYNMRCKGGLVSTSAQRNLGCGEWDYSCNTFVVDSSKIEQLNSTAPQYIITNAQNTPFKYTSKPVWDYYDFAVKKINLNKVVSEKQYAISTGNQESSNLLKTNEKSGKTHLLYTASELSAATFDAGNLNGITVDVANGGGATYFMKIKLKNYNASSLKTTDLQINGFTEVYNDHYSFKNGTNTILFHTPFVWDGSSNVLIEISFTNTKTDNPIILKGTLSSDTRSLFSNNNYALDLSSNGHVNVDGSKMSTISNEVSVGFWAYGDTASLPANTTVFYAYAAQKNERQLNIHFPWSNSNIVFDCGYSAGGYDRIEKTAVSSDFEGKWNYWTFTKNVNTGSMKIYQNGVLWFSGTGKSKPITIQNIILGKNFDLNENYKGKIAELSIWDKELDETTIKNWMNKTLDNTHPFYSNLVGYYKMNEGSGTVIKDSKFNLTGNGTNIQWAYDRGDKLTNTFTESTFLPSITFLRGVYDLTVSNAIARDSVVRNPNVVTKYAIKSNAGVTPLKHDEVNIVETKYLYEALPSKVYNGETGQINGNINVVSEGEITNSNLNYIRRFPFYNELVSFVTPYGIGLNLGQNGKNWFFDMSDYAPILKGRKRVLMTMGGQNQEDNDLEFWFIVGKPPRDVLEFNQLWQGGARVGGPSANSIINNTIFPELDVPILSNAKSVKLKSTITGHGSDGEFEQNGGQMSHIINIDGGTEEFLWSVYKECSYNPVFPQGGTWVYDRQGWCPGEQSVQTENDITFFITPGKSSKIDYTCSAPLKPSGDYRYISAHQLVTYGDANFQLDARITNIFRPTNNIQYGRLNPMCEKPFIEFQNTGAQDVTSIEIEYWINDGLRQTYTWTGNISFMEITTLQLPIGSLWSGALPSNNVFKVLLKKVNGKEDDNLINNLMVAPFDLPRILPGNLIVEFKTNNNPTENSYKIVDDKGAVVGSKSFSNANLTTKDSYTLNGCYRFSVFDSGQDGLQWWANAGQGNGSVTFKNSTGVALYTINPDFGGSFEFSFSTSSFVGTAETDFGTAIDIYPNPASKTLTVESFSVENAKIELFNTLGEKVSVPSQSGYYSTVFDISALTSGIYFVVIQQEGRTVTKKVVVGKE